MSKVSLVTHISGSILWAGRANGKSRQSKGHLLTAALPCTEPPFTAERMPFTPSIRLQLLQTTLNPQKVTDDNDIISLHLGVCPLKKVGKITFFTSLIVALGFSCYGGVLVGE